MAVPRKGEPSSIVGSISKLAGALVGTAVITGKRIIGSATPSSKGMRVKKKAVKRKPAGPSGKGGASKKKRAATPRKKTPSHKTKNTTNEELSSLSQDSLVSQTDAGTNVPSGEQEPQLRN